MEQTFSIKEVAEQTGLSPDTLRYYEKINLLPSPKRDSHANRIYGKTDIERIRFISFLKRTNMPLKKIEEYVKQYTQGDFEQCYQILAEHQEDMKRQIEELEMTMKTVAYKLTHFRELSNKYKY